MTDSDHQLAVETISDLLIEIKNKFNDVLTLQQEYRLNTMRFQEWRVMSAICQAIMELSEEMDRERNAPRSSAG